MCQDLLDAEGVAETFRSTTLSVTNSQHFSRTYYMVAPSDTERESWVESITNNIRSYSVSDGANISPWSLLVVEM